MRGHPQLPFCEGILSYWGAGRAMRMEDAHDHPRPTPNRPGADRPAARHRRPRPRAAIGRGHGRGRARAGHTLPRGGRPRGPGPGGVRVRFRRRAIDPRRSRDAAAPRRATARLEHVGRRPRRTRRRRRDQAAMGRLPRHRLDLQLRRRGIDTIVLGGIATNMGRRVDRPRQLRPRLPHGRRRGCLHELRTRASRDGVRAHLPAARTLARSDALAFEDASHWSAPARGLTEGQGFCPGPGSLCAGAKGPDAKGRSSLGSLSVKETPGHRDLPARMWPGVFLN